MQPKTGGGAASLLWKWLLGPWMAAVILMAYLWAKDLENFPDPPTARIIFWHVPMAWLAMAWFFTGAVYACRFLFGARRGSLDLDTRVKLSSEIGLLCTFLATVTGSVFAARQWNNPWNWDPKQVSITVLILFYVAYFGLRMSLDDPDLRGRLSAVYALIGAVATPFLMYVIPNLPQVSKLHPPGDVITGGLGTNWRIIYWMATFGFLGITVWMFQLRLRLIHLEAAEEDTVPFEDSRVEARREPLLRG